MVWYGMVWPSFWLRAFEQVALLGETLIIIIIIDKVIRATLPTIHIFEQLKG